MINKEILSILKSNQIRVDDGLVYLLCIYFKLKPDIICNNDVGKHVNTLGILSADELGGFKWNVPLFSQQETQFQWVLDEYLPLFKPFKKHRKYKSECVVRMKRFFSAHPSIRKEDVITATRNYITDCSRKNFEPQFVRMPHYFITKDKGSFKTSDLLAWVEELEGDVEETFDSDVI